MMLQNFVVLNPPVHDWQESQGQKLNHVDPQLFVDWWFVADTAHIIYSDKNREYHEIMGVSTN
jgi:hypothetical protein